MAGGGHHHHRNQPLGRAAEYKGRTTNYVILACIVAASGGLIFGYDIGVSGGVTSMDDFLQKFFPTVERNRHHKTKDQDYCQYDNQTLTMFTSSLYIAGLLASLLVASKFTERYGRKPSIILGGIFYLLGSAMNGAAVNLAMLIIGRILLGIAVGFGNQSVPLYLSEMAPPQLRGALNQLFQLAVTIGILCANVINYGTEKLRPWGWRLSLALAAVPAVLMITGGLFLPETPNSLIERGHTERGRNILVKIRGTEEVDAEYMDIVEASEKSKAIVSPFKNILARRSRPQLIMAILLPLFQQFTGINAIMFYAPILFKTIGFGSSASLYSAIITGVINMLSTFVSITTVDRVGRRALFLQGGIQMIVSQVVVAIILACKFGGDKQLSKGYAVFTVIVICIYVAGFAWSWGPLAWLVPSEIFPLETRSAGQAITVSVNLLFTFVIAQAFLAMLCHFKYGIFLFFAGLVVIMSLFVYYFVPETKGVPIEEMSTVWRNHWFWRKFSEDEDVSVLPHKTPATEMQRSRAFPK